MMPTTAWAFAGTLAAHSIAPHEVADLNASYCCLAPERAHLGFVLQKRTGLYLYLTSQLQLATCVFTRGARLPYDRLPALSALAPQAPWEAAGETLKACLRGQPLSYEQEASAIQALLPPEAGVRLWMGYRAGADGGWPARADLHRVLALRELAGAEAAELRTACVPEAQAARHARPSGEYLALDPTGFKCVIPARISARQWLNDTRAVLLQEREPRRVLRLARLTDPTTPETEDAHARDP